MPYQPEEVDLLEQAITKARQLLRADGPEVDYELIAGYLEGFLTATERTDVDQKIRTWANWHDAYWEARAWSLLSEGSQLKKGSNWSESQNESSISGSHPPIDRIGSSDGIAKSCDSQRSRFRAFAILATAASLAIVAGGTYWWGWQSGARIKDGVAIIRIDNSGAISGLESFPASQRDDLTRLLQLQSLETPEIYDEISREIGEKSSSENRSSVLRRPLGTAVLDDRPTLNWQSLPDAVSYRVVVSDSHGQDVRSGKTTTSQWRVVEPLPRGASYTWRVYANSEDSGEVVAPMSTQPKAKFKVVSEETLTAVRDSLGRVPGTHFGKVVVYLRYGLLDDVQDELDLLLQANPNIEVLRQLKSEFDAIRREAP